MDQIRQDFVFALRTLRKNYWVTFLAVGSLSLAIAGNAIVFSLMNGFLFRPLPWNEPERLVLIGERATGTPRGQISATSDANFLDLKERQSSFVGVAAMRQAPFSLDRGGEQPEQVQGAAVSPEFFSLLGVKAARGRLLAPEEGVVGRHRVAVLEHDYWANDLAGDEALVGQALELNGELYDVVGILPAGFEFLNPGIELYVPLAIDRAAVKRHQRDLLMVARLAPGVSDDEAQAEMDTLMASLAEEYPASNRGYAVDVLNLRHDFPDRQNRLFFLLIQVALLFVMLIACANIANLLLAKSQQREREISIRASLGATRARIVFQLITESMVMALAAGAVGLALSYGGIQVVRNMLGAFLPQQYAPVLDAQVLAVLLGLTLLGGLLFGLAPVLQTRRFDLVSSLKDGTQAASAGSRRRLVASGLVIAELAMALGFLGMAGIMLNSFRLLQKSDPGFVTEDLLVANLTLPVNRYREDEHILTGVEQLEERLAAVPEVSGVVISSTFPRTFFISREVFTLDADPPPADDALPRAGWLTANADYFDVLGIPLMEGRVFSPSDDAVATPVAVVNQAMAERHWGEKSPLGERLTLLGKSREIVGVVGDVRHGITLNTDFVPTVYLPFAQEPRGAFSVALRTRTEPDSVSESARRELLAFEPDMAITQMQSLDSFIEQFWVGQHLFSYILRGFGALALFLAAIGTYGVLAYSVAQRTQEIGVRMALGAGRMRILKMIAGQGMVLGAIGLGIGSILIFLSYRMISSIFSRVVPVEPMAIAGVVLVLAVVVLVASLLPARRAASLDPIQALRWE